MNSLADLYKEPDFSSDYYKDMGSKIFSDMELYSGNILI